MVRITDYQVKQREVGVNDIHQKHKVKILAFYMSMSMFRGEGIFVRIEKQGRRTSWKRKGKGGERKKKEKSDKTHVKYLYEA